MNKNNQLLCLLKDKPLKNKPVVNKPVEDKPLKNKPVVNKPVEDKLLKNKPVVNKPVVNKPVINKPVVNKPVVNKPVENKPVENKPIENTQVIYDKNMSVITFVIVISELILSIGNNLSYFLKKNGYYVQIIYKLSDTDIIINNPNYIFIIIWNERKDKKYPKNSIFYQVEQVNSVHFEIKNMNDARIIWEMSTVNYEKYKKIIPLNKIYIMPIPFYYDELDNKVYNDYKYDIFFYGTKNNRRDIILNEFVKKKYNIKIGFGICGEERDYYIKTSKIIINLSYYNNSSLETTRINEVLNFNKLIISEKSSNDYFNLKIYTGYIETVDRINDKLSNISDLFNLIDSYLCDENKYLNKINYIKNNKYKLKNLSEYFVKKNLLQITKNKDINIDYELDNTKITCLNLCETQNRLISFTNQQMYFNNKDLFDIYPAIKFNPSWLGCVYSYKNIIYNAKKSCFKNITICEDDCSFNNDFIEKYEIFKEFLEIINEWDLFVGVIANLPNNTILNNMYKYKGVTFIEINRMNSMVFNIYNHTIFDKILEWSPKPNNIENTLDAYIKTLDIKVIVPFPFEFSCLNVPSTIWGGKNLFDEYNKQFEKSNIIINKLINEYLKNNEIKIII